MVLGGHLMMLSPLPQRNLGVGRPRGQSLLEMMSILSLPKGSPEVALKALPYHLRRSGFGTGLIIRLRQSSHQLLLQSLRPLRLSGLPMPMLQKVGVALVLLSILEKSIEVFNQELLSSGEGYPAFSLLLLAAERVVHLGDVFLMDGRAFLGSVAEPAGIGLGGSLLLMVVESCIQGMAEEGQALRVEPLRRSSVDDWEQWRHGRYLFGGVRVLLRSASGRGRAIIAFG